MSQTTVKLDDKDLADLGFASDFDISDDYMAELVEQEAGLGGFVWFVLPWAVVMLVGYAGYLWWCLGIDSVRIVGG